MNLLFWIYMLRAHKLTRNLQPFLPNKVSFLIPFLLLWTLCYISSTGISLCSPPITCNVFPKQHEMQYETLWKGLNTKSVKEKYIFLKLNNSVVVIFSLRYEIMILINRAFKLSNQLFLVCYMHVPGVRNYLSYYPINNCNDYQVFVQFCLMAMKI